MSEADRIKWDLKFSKKEFVLGVGDSALNDFFRLKPIEPVLDFACGDGRNSLAMARKGIDVLAWDCSQVGLERLEHFSSLEQLKVNTLMLDFDHLPYSEPLEFGSVWISHFLPSETQLRWLFDKLPQGGLLGLLTFNQDQTDFNPRFCLKQDQFVETLGSKHLVKYQSRIEENSHHDFYVWKK